MSYYTVWCLGEFHSIQEQYIRAIREEKHAKGQKKRELAVGKSD